ncbi:MAG: zinc ABC transporter substrate-binding protein [Chlamydiales bacterium]
MNPFIFIILFLFSLFVGCSPLPSRDASWLQRNEKLKVLTTIGMIHDLVREIGGEEVDSMPLIRGGLDPHSYELVKGDDEKFARADLIFYNGLGLEHGLSLRQNLEDNPKAVAVGEALLEKDPSLILKLDGQYDPHIWMDIALWMHTIDPIVDALSRKDPAHAPLFSERGERLKYEMALADQKIFALLQAIPEEKRYLVTSHDALNYFSRHYLSNVDDDDWQERCKAPEGLAPNAQMSLVDIIDMVSHIESYGVSALFPESNVNRDALRKVAHAVKSRGIAIELSQECLYGDAMKEGDSYLEMIAHNARVIERGLKG